ncbi:MAG: hypothetical protein ACI4MF_04925 [Candidatus Faecivicinus sp.]
MDCIEITPLIGFVLGVIVHDREMIYKWKSRRCAVEKVPKTGRVPSKMLTGLSAHDKIDPNNFEAVRFLHRLTGNRPLAVLDGIGQGRSEQQGERRERS